MPVQRARAADAQGLAIAHLLSTNDWFSCARAGGMISIGRENAHGFRRRPNACRERTKDERQLMEALLIKKSALALPD